MRYLIYSILLNACICSAKAQDNTVKPLQIGDMVPDVVLEQIINYGDTSARISDFQGKLLVLDFWSTSCVACIAAFPKLERLQQQYQQQLVILPVATHRSGSKQRYLDFFKMRQERSMPINLPSVVEDSLLMKLFPFQSLPHIVWIGKEGVVLGITSGTDLNEKNIRDVLLNEQTRLPVKHSLVKNSFQYDRSKPLLVDDNGGASTSFAQRSVLTRFNSDIAGSGNLRITRDSAHTRVTMINSLLPTMLYRVFSNLYPEAFSGTTGAFVESEILCETTHEPMMSAINRWNSSEVQKYASKEDDYYCYELSLPGNKSDKEMLEAMKADLDRIFKVKTFMGRRQIPCLELQIADSVSIKTKFPEARSYASLTKTENGFYRMSLTNNRIRALANLLNSRFDYPFIVDMTGFDNRIDLDIQIEDKSDLKELQEKLRLVGISLLPAVRELEVLVVADAPN